MIIAWLKRRATDRLFRNYGPLAMRHQSAMLETFQQINGVAFNPWRWEHQRCIANATTDLKFQFLDHVFSTGRAKRI